MIEVRTLLVAMRSFKSMEGVGSGQSFAGRRTSSYAELERTELAHVEGGVYENEPAPSLDVVRESDAGSELELPEEGTTRSGDDK